MQTLIRSWNWSGQNGRIQNLLDDVELMYEYAGQIFCEMLGQTCYKEFYENDQMAYQEVNQFIVQKVYIRPL